MTHGARIAHLVVTCTILAGIIAQPFLIGLFLFGAVAKPDLHVGVGYALFTFGIPSLLVTSLLARLSRRELILSLLLMLDLVGQVVLVNLRDTAPVLAAFHPLNAFALLLLAVTIVRKDRTMLGQARSPALP